MAFTFILEQSSENDFNLTWIDKYQSKICEQVLNENDDVETELKNALVYGIWEKEFIYPTIERLKIKERLVKIIRALRKSIELLGH